MYRKPPNPIHKKKTSFSFYNNNIHSAERIVVKKEIQVEIKKEIEKSLCIFLQLHNDLITPEIIEDVNNIYKNYKDFDVYITVINKSSIDLINSLLSNTEWKDNVITIDLFFNRGMDIGAFLWQLERINKRYKCLLKFHTKTDKDWRRKMIEPFITDNIKNYIEELGDLNNKIGFIGAKKLFSKEEWKEFSITRNIEKSSFNRVTHFFERRFIAGSVFMINFDIIMNMIKNHSINKFVKSCYTNMPIGRVNDNIPHSFERFICYYPILLGLRYKLID